MNAQKKSKQADKVSVVCARCGWLGKRSTTSDWPACPRCGAHADLIIERKSKSSKAEKHQSA